MNGAEVLLRKCLIELSKRKSMIVSEMQEFVPDSIGNVSIYINKHTAIWHNMSHEFADGLLDAIDSKLVIPFLSSKSIYLDRKQNDIILPEYPIAKSHSKTYKEKHWLPIILVDPTLYNEARHNSKINLGLRINITPKNSYTGISLIN